MKVKSQPLNERGVAHIGLILILLIIIAGAGYFAFKRVDTSNNKSSNTSTSSTDAASIDSASKTADQNVPSDTTTQEAPNVN